MEKQEETETENSEKNSRRNKDECPCKEQKYCSHQVALIKLSEKTVSVSYGLKVPY